MTFPVPLQAANLVAGFEGFRASPYQDQRGVWTFGFGSTRDAYGAPVTAHTPPITRAAATVLLNRDLGSAAQAVARECQVALNDSQASALVSLAYNVGEAAEAGSALIKKLNAHDFTGAADQFLVWNRCGGVVNKGLVARRAAERKVFLEPCKTPWPPTGAPVVVVVPAAPKAPTDPPKAVLQPTADDLMAAELNSLG